MPICASEGRMLLLLLNGISSKLKQVEDLKGRSCHYHINFCQNWTIFFRTIQNAVGTRHFNIRELTILGRERRPRLHKTKTAITEIKAVQLCRKHNLKDLSSE